jgi:hypothetical protein
VGLTICAVLIVVGLRAEAYRRPNFHLHDAGVWVTNTQHLAIGRVNTEIALVDTRVAAPDAPPSFDVLQSGASVLLFDQTTNKLYPINPALASPGIAQAVPAKAQVALGGETVAVADGTGGRLWLARADTIAGAFGDSLAIKVGGGSVVAVGLDGTTYVLTPGTGTVKRYGADRKPLSTSNLGRTFSAEARITAVGAKFAVLDVARHEVLMQGRPPVDIAALGSQPVLQQAGPAASFVLLATDKRLVQIPFAGGEPQTLSASGTGGAVAPVFLAGCAYGAWGEQPTYVQWCPGHEGPARPFPNLPPHTDLRFRVNRNRVLLNDLAGGASIVFAAGGPTLVTDWSQVLNAEAPSTDAKNSAGAGHQKFDRSGPNRPPVANPLSAATRPGRPVILRPLQLDSDPDGDVLVIEPPAALPAAAGTVALIQGGQALQFSPDPSRVDPVSFPYTINDGRDGKASSVVTVNIHPPDQNAPPGTHTDQVQVEVGKTIFHNVLLSDVDPDGDAMTLTNATAPAGTVSTQPDGTIMFMAPATPGRVTVNYTVMDEFGAGSPGQLAVDVGTSGSQPPYANNAALQTLVGHEATVNVLAADSDPGGNPLTLASVEDRPDARMNWDPSGRISFTADQPGSYAMAFNVSDGTGSDTALLRVDVLEPAGHLPPVAVRDDVVLRANAPTTVPVLANDVDPSGDVMAIRSIDVPSGTGLTVQTLDHGELRITATSPLSHSVEFTYTVSDGLAQSVGMVVVRPAPSSGVDQAPVTVPDDLSVRAGNVMSIPILSKVVDPEGDQLTLLSTSELPAADGVAFVEGDQLRYQAPPAERGSVMVTYTVEDSAHNRADGRVSIHVTTPDGTQNRPPVPPHLEARTLLGHDVTIKLPLASMDPESDPVALVGLVDPPSLGLIVSLEPDRIVYRADATSAGTDRFTYRVRDQFGAEATGVVAVGVVPPADTNSPPVAGSVSAAVRPGGSVSLDVLGAAADPDDDPITLGPIDAPKAGTATVEKDSARIVYQAPSPAGPDDAQLSLGYEIDDGRGGTCHGSVAITVSDHAPDQPPVALDDLVAAQPPGASVTVSVLANDTNPAGSMKDVTVAVAKTPGVEVLPDGTLRVVMPPHPLAFIYTITNAKGQTARAFVEIPLASDPAPVTRLAEARTNVGQAVSVDVLSVDSDPLGRPLKLNGVVKAQNGTATLVGNRVSFLPTPKYFGDAWFAYVVTAGSSNAVGLAVVHVAPPPDLPPRVSALSLQVPAGGSRTIDLLPSARNPYPGDRFTFSNLNTEGVPAGLTAQLGGSQLTVHAADDARGAEGRFRFTVGSVKSKGTAEGSVSIRVVASDRPLPIAVPDQVTAKQEQALPIHVLANDIDPIGRGLQLLSVDPSPAGGQARISGPDVVFTPTTGFFGQTTFTYRMVDATGDPARAVAGAVTVVVIGRPSAPAAPVGAVASRLVSLSWAVPAANGAPIDYYDVKTDSGAIRCPTNTCTFAGLTNGTAYKFVVVAHNAAGDGPASASSPSYTPNAIPGVPNAPTGAFGDGEVTVTWTAPPDDGTALTGYDVEISPSTGLAVQSAASTSLVWRGLANGTGYTFRVAAKNAAGSSGYSPASSMVTPAGIPRNVIAPGLTAGDSTIGATWTQPDPNGDAIQAYQLRPVSDGTAQSVVDVADPTQRAATIPASNGSVYTVAIRARNKAGWSTWSPPSAQVTPAGVPAKVGGVSAADNDTASTLSFAAPSDNGAAISVYKVAVNGGAAQVLPNDRVVRGLTNGASYTFQVQACNRTGCGGLSAPSNTSVPFGAPGQPQVGASVNATTITWSWGAVGGNGRPLARYEVRLDNNLVAQDLNTSFSRSFGFSETHSLSVVAVNSAGVGSSPGGAQASTNPPPTQVTLSRGVSAVGATGCSSSGCSWFNIDGSGFTANATLPWECWSDRDGKFFPTPGRTLTVRSDGGGNIHLVGNPQGCYADPAGVGHVWVVVNGVQSAHVSW